VPTSCLGTTKPLCSFGICASEIWPPVQTHHQSCHPAIHIPCSMFITRRTLPSLSPFLHAGLAEAGINPGSGTSSDPGSTSLCGITFSVYDGDTSNLGDLTQEQMSQVSHDS
jgi:hypothetical protein